MKHEQVMHAHSGRRIPHICMGKGDKKERNPLQKGHMKDIGSVMGETVLSLSPILGGKITK